MSGARHLRVCDTCLRRALLIGVLAPRLQAVLDGRSRTPSEILALGDRDLVAAVAGSRPEASRFLASFDAHEARADLVARGVAAVCQHADRYPAKLHELGDPPAVLFGIGRVEEALRRLRATPAVALVGSRRASTYALEMARSLGRGLGAARVPVVSGLALGVDAAAHEGCLDGNGFPIAVLGGGADVPYPRTNLGLYERIRERGAIFAEMPPGQRPYRWGFPARNRIMAGLAEATVVVEAAPRSGSLITTEYAADLGRLVGAVPGQATNRGARGSNALFGSGASLILETRDILDELFGVGKRPAESAEPASGGGPDRLADTVLEGIAKEWPLGRICAEAGAGIGEVRAALTRLEAAGLVLHDGLGGYARRATPVT